MHKFGKFGFSVVLFGAVATLASPQEMNPTATPPPPSNSTPQGPSEYQDGVPVYKIQVVARDIPINYFHRQGSTKIGFEGTSAAGSEGRCEGRCGVRSYLHQSSSRGVAPANGFGPEYLTYVLWAISPEGRPVNLGEVLPTGSKNKFDATVTTNLQAFGLIVTAEPYFAVTMPSDLVVMQNVVTDKTQGVIEQVNAHYTLLPRGAYAETAGRHSVLHPITRDERSPLELYEAENAIQIADAAVPSNMQRTRWQRQRRRCKMRRGWTLIRAIANKRSLTLVKPSNQLKTRVSSRFVRSKLRTKQRSSRHGRMLSRLLNNRN